MGGRYGLFRYLPASTTRSTPYSPSAPRACSAAWISCVISLKSDCGMSGVVMVLYENRIVVRPLLFNSINSINGGKNIHELLSLHHAKENAHPDQPLPARSGAIPEGAGEQCIQFHSHRNRCYGRVHRQNAQPGKRTHQDSATLRSITSAKIFSIGW